MDSHNTKIRELGIARRVLHSLGHDPDRWTLDPHESPDILARTPQGELLGIEISEVLSPEHGRQRAYDHAVASIHLEPVEGYIRRLGGSGGVITGALDKLPMHRAELAHERAMIERWLEKNGLPLHVDGAEMIRKRPLIRHRFGYLTGISRDDSLGMFRLDAAGDAPFHVPPYKQPQSPYEIEASILSSVEAKIKKFAHYERDTPTWLVLRNPSRGLDRVSEELLASTRTTNGGRFFRIILFNEPEDQIVAGRRAAACLDLL